MKNKIKLFSIITPVVIISFMTAGCLENIEATVTSVTISPASATVAKGADLQFTATVTGTNNPAKTVTWSIVQTNKNPDTTISASGLLTVAAEETLKSLTVMATSTADITKSRAVIVKINETGTEEKPIGVQFSANISGNKHLSR